jgi:hypothetical protein
MSKTYLISLAALERELRDVLRQNVKPSTLADVINIYPIIDDILLQQIYGNIPREMLNEDAFSMLSHYRLPPDRILSVIELLKSTLNSTIERTIGGLTRWSDYDYQMVAGCTLILTDNGDGRDRLIAELQRKLSERELEHGDAFEKLYGRRECNPTYSR